MILQFFQIEQIGGQDLAGHGITAQRLLRGAVSQDRALLVLLQVYSDLAGIR